MSFIPGSIQEKQNELARPYLPKFQEVLSVHFDEYRQYIAETASKKAWDFWMNIPAPKPQDFPEASEKDDTRDLTDLILEFKKEEVSLRYGARVQFDKPSYSIGVRCWTGGGGKTQYHKWKALPDHEPFKIRAEIYGWTHTGNPELESWIIFDPILFRENGYLDVCWNNWINKPLWPNGRNKNWFLYDRDKKTGIIAPKSQHSGGGFIDVKDISSCVLCTNFPSVMVRPSKAKLRLAKEDLLF